RLLCGSRSTVSTFLPRSASATPRFRVVVVFATPPFWFANAITWPKGSAPPTGRSRGVNSASGTGFLGSVAFRIRPQFAWNKCNPARPCAFSRRGNASARACDGDPLGRRRVRRGEQVVQARRLELAQVAGDEPLHRPR